MCKYGHTYDKLTFTLSATIRCDSSSNKWLSTNGPVKRRKSLRMKNRVSGCEFEKKGYVQEAVGLRKMQNESFFNAHLILL